MTPASPSLSATKSTAFGRPRPVVDPPVAPATETWTERIFGALPLFVVGGICIGIAVDLYYMSATAEIAGVRSARISPWVLFVALGVTGLAAGIFAVFSEEEPEVAPTPRTTPATSAPLTPAWDESNLVPDKSGYVRPRTWEQYPIEPGDVIGWSPVEPGTEHVSPDVVLVQIDEIAASLRRKTPPRSPPASVDSKDQP